MARIVNSQHYTYKVAFQALGKHLALVIEYYRKSLGKLRGRVRDGRLWRLGWLGLELIQGLT